MSETEQTHEHQSSEAIGAEFLRVHVNETPADYDDYVLDRMSEWRDKLITGVKEPMWLRRTFEMGSEFGVVIDYCLFDKSFEQVHYGYITIDNESVDTILPQKDPETGEMIPVQVMTEPYSRAAIADAKHLVEEYFRSQ